MRALSIVTTCGLLFVAILGCESRVSLGAQCSLSSDCPVPLVCAAGRCRIECAEARDCAFPLECMRVANASGCRVPEDGACPRGTMDCGPGLECIDGRCAQPCMDHSQCSLAQTCASGSCDRLPIDSGCDLLSGAGCAEGTRCTPSGDCVPLGATEVRSAELTATCDPTNACRQGLTCVDGRCMRWCEFEPDMPGVIRTSCGDGSYCSGSDTSGGDPPPDGFGYCTQPCDPTRTGVEAGCSADYNCGVSLPGGRHPDGSERVFAVCEPRAADMEGTRYSPCQLTPTCAEGLDCINGVYDEPFCMSWCDDQADCDAAGEYCDLDPSRTHTVLDADGTARTVGACLPRCSDGASCDTLFDSDPGTFACPDGHCVPAMP